MAPGVCEKKAAKTNVGNHVTGGGLVGDCRHDERDLVVNHGVVFRRGVCACVIIIMLWVNHFISYLFLSRRVLLLLLLLLLTSLYLP